MATLDTDYLIIGAGATGMAFADTLLSETDAHITLVDRHGKPGGHWNDAYPFVTLHQPSAFYGVNSMELGHRRKDTAGVNQGLYELASGAEINAYYDRVMQQRLLPSGRVGYHPMCDWQDAADGSAGGQLMSLLSGEATQVRVRRKVVDANYYGPRVPSTHTPRFAVGAGAWLLPPNALPHLAQNRDGRGLPKQFMILGAGKTAMDAAMWLLQSGARPESIRWVMPRDSWLVNRITTQPAIEFFNEAIGGMADQMEAFAQATTVDDLYLRLEACGFLLRIHPGRTPSMFHLATISPGEVQALRRIEDVIRLGRVTALAADHVVLEQGRVELAPGTLCIDCTASAVDVRPIQPVFQPHRIVPAIVRLPLPTFSAALIAWVEAHLDDDKSKNRLCVPVPFPHTLAGYVHAMMVSSMNQFQWSQDKALRQWMRDSRLDGFGRLMTGIAPDDTAKLAIMGRLKAAAMPAMANMQKLMAASA